jgi:hypothetical protein
VSKLSIDRDRTERLQVMLSADEIAAIDNFRFQARMPSRAAAVRELLRRGLIIPHFEVLFAILLSSELGRRVAALIWAKICRHSDACHPEQG